MIIDLKNKICTLLDILDISDEFEPYIILYNLFTSYFTNYIYIFFSPLQLGHEPSKGRPLLPYHRIWRSDGSKVPQVYQIR